MKECPFCLRPVGNDEAVCGNCGRQVDIFRTGYFARPDLPKSKTALIWAVVALVLALLAAGLARACSSTSSPKTAHSSR